MTSKYEFLKVWPGWAGIDPQTPAVDPKDSSNTLPGYYVGQNALSSLAEAFAAQQDNTVRINVLNYYDEYAFAPEAGAYGNVDLELESGAIVTVSSDWTWGKDADDASTIYIQDGAQLRPTVSDANMTMVGKTSVWLQATSNVGNTEFIAADTLTLQDETAIYGAGTLQANYLALEDKASVILNNGSKTKFLSADTAEDTVIKLDDHSELKLVGTPASEFNGTLDLLDGSKVVTTEDAASITNSGVVNAVSTELDADSLAGFMFKVTTNMTNTGTINLYNAAIADIILAYGDQSKLTNFGNILVSGNPEVSDDNQGSVLYVYSLTNDEDGAITVKDKLSQICAMGTLTNNGTITVDSATGIAAQTLYNYGKITVSKSSDSDHNAAIYTSNQLLNEGTIELDDVSKIVSERNVTLGDDSRLHFKLDKASEGVVATGTADGEIFANIKCKIFQTAFKIVGEEIGTATLSVDMGDATGKVYTLVYTTGEFQATCFGSDGIVSSVFQCSTLAVDFNGAKYEEFAFTKNIDVYATPTASEKERTLTATNDLYAVQTSNIQINYTADAYKTVAFDEAGDYRVVGLNWFATVEAASEATSWGSRTYELVYEDNVENDTTTLANMNFVVTVNSGFTKVTIAEKASGNVLTSFNATSGKAVNVAITEGEAYTITFDGENADYDFSANFQDTIANELYDLGVFGGTTSDDKFVQDPDPDNYHKYTFTDKITGDGDSDTTTTNKVGFNTGAQEYKFEIDDNDSGLFFFTIGTEEDPYAFDTSDRITYKIVEETSGKTIMTGSVADGNEITRSANLLAGTYTITIDSYDHGAGRYNAIYSLDIVGIRNENVGRNDNDITCPIANPETSLDGMKTLTVNGTVVVTDPEQPQPTKDPNQLTWNVKDFVGLSDKTDFVFIDFEKVSGSYTIGVKTEEDTAAAGMRVKLYCEDGTTGKVTTLKSMTYKGDTQLFKDVMFDAANKYYIQVSVASANSSTYNANYFLGIHRESANTGLNHDNNKRDDVKNNPDYLVNVGEYYADWVGNDDELDWVKLNVADGDYNLVFDASGDRVFATIYKVKTNGKDGSLRKESGSLQTVESLNLYNGKTVQEVLSCDSRYDYYVRFKATSGSDISSNYKLGLAVL